MNTAAADRITKAVLYEGYMLYPYRPSALKNQQRFNFGVVYPQIFSEEQRGTNSWIVRTECLIQGSMLSRIEVRIRFLQLVERSIDELIGDAFRPVKSLRVDSDTFYAWQEAVERELRVPATDVDLLNRHPILHPFELSSQTTEEALLDHQLQTVGRIVRTQQAIDGSLAVAAHPIAENIFKIVVQLKNFTPIDQRTNRDLALMRSLVSVHVVLGVEEGEFISLLDPPEQLRPAAEQCQSQGVFPVLVGEPEQRDTMLASPIILYDYPQIAPESAGDLFDGTEIDEILSLRIMTMTEEEKREMRESDERARQMLERTETMPAEQFMKLHGVLRGLRPVNEEIP
jgi:hydrogenase maturation protease